MDLKRNDFGRDIDHFLQVNGIDPIVHHVEKLLVSFVDQNPKIVIGISPVIAARAGTEKPYPANLLSYRL